jgi:hypothetical protein
MIKYLFQEKQTLIIEKCNLLNIVMLLSADNNVIVNVSIFIFLDLWWQISSKCHSLMNKKLIIHRIFDISSLIYVDKTTPFNLNKISK